MSVWSAIGTWAMGQFTDNFMGGDKKGGSIMDRVIGAGASAIGDKFLDTPSAAGRPPKVDLGVTNAKTYAMSAAKAPETPVVTDAVAMDDKWTSVAKRLAQIQDTTAIGK